MAAALLLALAAGLHPQDGPDADVRLAIEPGATRLSVTLNLVFLDQYVEPFREDDQLLHEAEYALAQELGFELLEGAVKVKIDGIEVTPRITGFEVAPPDPDLIPHFPRYGTRAMTKLRWVLEYPTKADPGEVDLSWSLFPPDELSAVGPQIPTLEIVAHVKAEGSSRRITLTEDGPRIRWESDPGAAASRFLEVPLPPAGTGPTPLSLLLYLGGVVCIAVGRRRPLAWVSGLTLVTSGALFSQWARPVTMDDERARAIFEPLHQNLYRAFDYTRREDIYDALARSVTGDLLDDLYDQVFTSLIQAEEGGAVSEVQELRRLSLEAIDLDTDHGGRPGFTVRTRWQLDGAVFHFGHSHWRTNEYEARFGVASTQEGWRLASHEMLEAVRVDAAPITPPRPEEEF